MEKQPAPPVVTREELLPLLSNSIDYRQYEAFCLDLVRYMPDLGSAGLFGDVYHYGKSGDAQQGIDIVCRMQDGTSIGVQCKQVAKFTPANARKMLAAATFPAQSYIAMLAGEATAGVRTEIAKHSNWRLFDVRDISRWVRHGLPPSDAVRLVRQHFGEKWCADFLGISSTPERITYEKTTRQRLGTITKHQLIGIGCLGSAASLTLAGSSIFAMPQLSLATMPLAALLLGLALAAAALLMKIALMVIAGETTIRILNTLIETDEDGLVYWSKVVAHCPICAGQVDIEGTPEHFGLNTVGICERNPRMHIFTFDKTVMIGELLPIELRERLQRVRERQP
jgi:hypothetical protein